MTSHTSALMSMIWRYNCSVCTVREGIYGDCSSTHS